VLIDPTEKPINRPDIVLFTHAHLDHVSGAPHMPSTALMFSSKPTKTIIEFKYPKLKGYMLNTLPIGLRIELDNLAIEAYDAGHVVGSRQYVIDHRGIRVGVTGDINTVKSLTEQPAERLRDIDILVIEATYGSDFYIFPDRSDLYAGINHWVKETLRRRTIPIMAGYALGKAQELTALASRIIGINVYVTREVARYNKVFEEHRGRKLGWGILEPSRTPELASEDAVIITSNSNALKLASKLSIYGIKCETAYFSGWALSRRYPGRGFPLSSHADHKMLVDYVDDVKPKIVYTVYGFKRSLAKSLRRKLGIEANPIRVISPLRPS